MNGSKQARYFTLTMLFVFASIFCFSQNWDIDALKGLNLDRNRSLDGFFRMVTDYAAPIAYSIPFFLFFYSLLTKNNLLKEKSIYVIQSAALALIIATAVKYIVNRPRPFVTYPFIQKVTSGGSPSFPSGHTSDAFTLAASLSFAFPKWYVIVPSFAWAAAVGYSRMELGVHYPSDVLASVMIAILSAFVCFKLKKRRERKAVKTKT